ncbi:MAG: PAS domain-containing protein [Gemmatimonadaceae bacterium]|nr:PAS domain-containing protein [Gemmatimonadaceae bacterium]
MPAASATELLRPSRLAALRATGLLDAPPQEALDRLTRLASRLMGVPIALLSLVDENRQRFASQVGLTGPVAEQRETPLTHSFCQHVVATRAALIVEDARIDPLVSDNLAIRDLGVIAYAGMPITSESGEVLGSFCAIDTSARAWTDDQLDILRDLAHAATAEVQLRAASRLLGSRQLFLADLLDHTRELVCATDVDGRITYANSAMIEALGYSAEELAQRRPVELVAPDCAADFLDAARRVLGGEIVERLDTVVVTASGDRLHCQGRATPLTDADGVPAGARIMFRDLTREREAQRLKDELIALVSHELRTPVGAILVALKVLKPHVEQLEGKPRRLFEIAARNADRLLLLVNDLLDIERLEAGHERMDRAPTPVAALLDQAADSMMPLAENGDVRIVVTATEGDVSVDAKRVLQVLVNLIGNAIKFSPPESTITLSAESQSAREGGVERRFCVADEGRGIPQEKLALVFGRFEQVATSDARDKGGAGLGLAVSKAIVEQHGGRIWVESSEGAGSRFYFTIPDLATA